MHEMRENNSISQRILLSVTHVQLTRRNTIQFLPEIRVMVAIVPAKLPVFNGTEIITDRNKGKWHQPGVTILIRHQCRASMFDTIPVITTYANEH